VAASDWLSTPSPFQNSPLDPSNRLAPIRIGVSTQQEIVVRLGNPADHQMHSIDGMPFESLGYATTETQINPFQYLPLFGAFAFRGSLTSQTPSTAISFSPQGVVSGLTISTVNAHGDIRSPEIFPMTDSSTSFYGMKNPDVSHARADSSRSKP